jgi:hypothetical protein
MRLSGLFAGGLLLIGFAQGLMATPSTCAVGQSLNTWNTNGGCTLIDDLFSAFTSSSTLDANSINNISGGLLAQGGTNGGSVITNTALGLSSADFNLGTAGTSTTAVDFFVQGNYQPPAPTTLSQWAFNDLAVGGSFSTHAGDTVTVEIDYCLNASAAVGVGNSFFAACLVANQASIVFTNGASTHTINGVTTPGNDISLVGLPPVFSMAMRVTVTITEPVGGDSGATTPILVFGQDAVSPEPATMWMLGLGLAGMLAWRRRGSIARRSLDARANLCSSV